MLKYLFYKAVLNILMHIAIAFAWFTAPVNNQRGIPKEPQKSVFRLPWKLSGIGDRRLTSQVGRTNTSQLAIS